MTMRLKLSLLLVLALQITSCGFFGRPYQIQGYIEGQNIYLASPFSGVLKHLMVHRGQTVKKGQLLFKLDSNPQVLTLNQVENELKQATNILTDLRKPRRKEEITALEAQIQGVDAQIKLAEIRVKRNEELVKRQAVDKDSMDAAIARQEEQKQLKAQYQANLELAKLGSRPDQIQAQEAQVHNLEAKLQEARWQLSQKTLTAPATGIIFDTYYREGEFVGSQQPVLSLLTPENIRVEFFIPVDRLPLIKLQQKINFSCAGCAPNNEAIISYISPEAEFLPPLVYSRENDDKLVFRVKAQIPQALNFKPGQPVTVSLP